MGEAQATVPITRDGKTVLERIRENSLTPPRYDPPQSTVQSSPPAPPPLPSTGASPPLPQLKRYTLSDTASSSPPGPNRTSSPNRYTPSTAPPSGRAPSPGRKLRKGHEHSDSSTSIASNASGRLGGGAGAGRPPSPGRNPRPRLNLGDLGPVPALPSSESNTVYSGATGDHGAGTPKPGRHPTTFAEMGFVGVKADDKECIIM